MSQMAETVLQKHFKINDIIQIEKDEIGHTSAQVYIISTEYRKLVLKIHNNVNDKYLFNLRNKLTWLEDKLPISKVKDYKIIENKEYILTEFMEGIPSFEFGHQSTTNNVGIILGESLRKIHDLNIQKCPFKLNIDDRISKLLNKIERDNVDQDILNFHFPNSTKAEILEQTKSLILQKWNLVFSHGDYCLPNILISNNKLSGFIDMGDSGVADRNYDLYYGLWSLKYNDLEKYSDDFINSYGKDRVSEKKLKLFKLLDEVLWKGTETR